MMLTRKEFNEMQDVLSDALEFLRYFSDSPEELDARVEKQLRIVEREIASPEDKPLTMRFEYAIEVLLQHQRYIEETRVFDSDDKRIEDIEDTINNLYCIRETNPTKPE